MIHKLPSILLKAYDLYEILVKSWDWVRHNLLPRFVSRTKTLVTTVKNLAKEAQQTFVLMKTSWRRLEDVFRLRLQNTSSRRLDQDEYVRLSLTSSENVFKTSSGCLGQGQYIRLDYTFPRRLQDVYKTSCQDVLKTFSRCRQDVLQKVFKTSSKRLQEVFKTSSRRLEKRLQDNFKTSSRRIIKLNSSC